MRGVKTGGRAVDERLLETVEAFIKKHQRTNGRSPTLRQIMHEFHVSSRRSQKYNGMYLF